MPAAMIQPDFSPLDAVGLNLHAVLALDRLPAALRADLDPEGAYRQLILIGNGGRALWAAIKAGGIAGDNPIDDFSVRQVEAWLATQSGAKRHALVYPGDRPVGLQALGELAGWHFASPFMIGINARWGSWFAYRVAVLTDSEFALSTAEPGVSPCASCRARPCVKACPGGAIDDDGFALQRCIACRKTQDSACRLNCVARLACPVRQEMRYSDEQLRHSGRVSLRAIERYF